MRQLEIGDALKKLSCAFTQSNRKAIFFYIHGWNVPPRDPFCDASRITNKSKYLAIPIIWHTYRETLFHFWGKRIGKHSFDYRFDRVHTAPDAGTQLSAIYPP